jgi:hypothetical protein
MRRLLGEIIFVFPLTAISFYAIVLPTLLRGVPSPLPFPVRSFGLPAALF